MTDAETDADAMARHAARPEYRLTFGAQYPRVGHPRYADADADGWVTIVADDYEHARQTAVALFSVYWSDLYDATQPGHVIEAQYFPRGELVRIIAPPRQADPDAD